MLFAGTYSIPPGSGDPPKLDEEGNAIEDPDKPPLPAFPKCVWPMRTFIMCVGMHLLGQATRTSALLFCLPVPLLPLEWR